MKRILLLALLMSILCAVVAQEALFVCEPYPPYESMSNGKPIGMDIEVIDMICKDAGISYRIEFYPWERCLAMVKSGQAQGIFGILKTNERLSFLNYPSVPISFDKRVVISQMDYKKEIKSISDLSGETIGVVSGYAFNEEFDKATNFKRDKCMDSATLVKKFMMKRNNLIATNEYVAKSYMGNYPFLTKYTICQDPLYLAFTKSYNYKKFEESAVKNKLKIRQILNKYK